MVTDVIVVIVIILSNLN